MNWVCFIFFCMSRRLTGSTCTHTLFPSTTLVRCDVVTERVVTLTDLLRSAPQEARADIIAWANASQPKVALLDQYGVTALRERARPPSAIRRQIGRAHV